MPAGAEQIYVQRLHVYGQLPEGLYGIRMEQNAPLFCDGPDLSDGLYGADLIIGKHDADQDGIRPHSLSELSRIHKPVFVYLEICHLEALLFQICAGLKHRMMLDPGSDDMPPLPLTSLRCGSQRPVVRLGPP